MISLDNLQLDSFIELSSEEFLSITGGFNPNSGIWIDDGGALEAIDQAIQFAGNSST